MKPLMKALVVRRAEISRAGRTRFWPRSVEELRPRALCGAVAKEIQSLAD